MGSATREVFLKLNVFLYIFIDAACWLQKMYSFGLETCQNKHYPVVKNKFSLPLERKLFIRKSKLFLLI